ncbi:hypothetical protein ACIBO6_28775 [Streptomyces luteogriseus]|uniref:hypothetical protein n=1 Tax=Streptomyces luteogriseus TaxID=68233 RepID=UPI00378B6FEA
MDQPARVELAAARMDRSAIASPAGDDQGQRAATAVRAQVELLVDPPRERPRPRLLHHLHQPGEQALPGCLALVFCRFGLLRRGRRRRFRPGTGRE